ncbi:MAG: 1-acyl-sn-glycerol-3-phosphate acyltransferase [Clostridia bacterium]|nr:1-acyl-sn-glycerol-3-phosphate acyltransferase [Clostridia bacterium]
MKTKKQEELALSRKKVLEKIAEYEKLARFNDDVEEDPVSPALLPDDVDYLIEKRKNKFLTKLANFMGYTYFEHMIKNKKFIIKEICGIENFINLSGGAIITCNHFNIRDNYAVYRAIRPYMGKKQMLYKVIKEGNFFRAKGMVGLLMKHANTLPLSSNYDTMKKFYRSVGNLLDRGEKILIYPEQAMWWNYKKPRPLVDGAFKLATQFNKPILPVFVTMKDSKIVDDDGYLVQEYYVNFLQPIFPNKDLKKSENIENMKKENYDAWVKTYEKFYDKKLEYISN